MVIPTFKNGQEVMVPISDVVPLVCYPDPHESEIGFFMSLDQRLMIANYINNELIRYGNKSISKREPESQLERIIKQMLMVQQTIGIMTEGAGKKFVFRVK